MTTPLANGPRWFVAGDLDGFLGLALDNLIQILLILGLCGGVLGYPSALLLGTILPAMGISLLLGNLANAWQAYQRATAEGRSDRTALPYGINTVSLFEAAGAFSAELLRRWLPRAALLSTLAGIALGYIAPGFLLRTYAQPVVGLTMLQLGWGLGSSWALGYLLMAVVFGLASRVKR